MKYVVITFDDGRSDNYLIAKKIMEKYNLTGTVYITTGFIDGTWSEKEILKSPTRALKKNEIKNLKSLGWEIGLHGDKHKTQVNDMEIALNKLNSWEINENYWGISIPNSRAAEEEIEKILKSNYGNKILYIRRGRRCNTASLKSKVLFLMYSIFKWKWAYNIFNRSNIINNLEREKFNIPSVVIKSNDDPKMVINFINYIPEGSIVVFMLHSILPVDHLKYNKDSWSWGEDRFNEFCFELKKLKDNKVIELFSLKDMILKNKVVCQSGNSKK